MNTTHEKKTGMSKLRRFLIGFSSIVNGSPKYRWFFFKMVFWMCTWALSCDFHMVTPTLLNMNGEIRFKPQSDFNCGSFNFLQWLTIFSKQRAQKRSELCCAVAIYAHMDMVEKRSRRLLLNELHRKYHWLPLCFDLGSSQLFTVEIQADNLVRNEGDFQHMVFKGWISGP